jgi:formamidase
MGRQIVEGLIRISVTDGIARIGGERLDNTAETKAPLVVQTYTNGTIGPSEKMLGPVHDGSTVLFVTAPGCWGPMITPHFKGGHEVTRPLAIHGAEPGDALAVRIRCVRVTSISTASGTDSPVPESYTGDPFVARRCPNCGTDNPPTERRGIGQDAIRCLRCGAECSPFRVSNGYTIVFDHGNAIGVTVDKDEAERIAANAAAYSALPAESRQHSILTYALHDISGVVARLRPFIGNIGTTPPIDMPVSHNAGDFGQFLVGARHAYGISREQLDLRTDGHMDLDSVRDGAILICPVKCSGGGLYVGDVHAMQGDGELAGHTTDVSSEVTAEIKVLKGFRCEGPVLLPCLEDLPFLARPMTDAEWTNAVNLARSHGVDHLERGYPMQFVGSGSNVNEATENALTRAVALLEMTLNELRNRITITGAVEIARLPGVVTVTLLVSTQKLERLGIVDLVRRHYGDGAASNVWEC